jgi:hypothetical protein
VCTWTELSTQHQLPQDVDEQDAHYDCKCGYAVHESNAVKDGLGMTGRKATPGPLAAAHGCAELVHVRGLARHDPRRVSSQRGWEPWERVGRPTNLRRHLDTHRASP